MSSQNSGKSNYQLWTDGAVTKNPGGQASYGYLLKFEGKEIDFGYGIIGSGANMNNVMAECYAITQGLSSFIRVWDCPKPILYIYNDSKFVISQLNSEKKRLLKNPFSFINFQLQQIKNFVDVKLVWIPRSGNSTADILSKRLRNDLNCQKHT
jgi:ribonuclease HI